MKRSKFKKIILSIPALILVVTVLVWHPQKSFATVETFTSSGTWTVPTGVTSVIVECWGGGGSGGGGANTNYYGGGGGAGGQYSKKTITIDQGSYSYVVGASVVGVGRGSNGNTGNDTTFGSTLVVAKGGAGGKSYANGGTGGAGSTSNGVGDTVYAGGSGATKGSNYAGGGGSGAGSSGTGNSSTSSTGASAKSENGGAGGNGSTASSGNGIDGSTYGGGGGGATRNGTSGAGAQGFIRITYTIPTVPGAPTSLSATAGAGKIDLSWTTPSSDGGSAITGYKIYRDTSSSPTTLLTTTGVTNSYSDTSVTPGTQYYYRVKATNVMGDSDYSNESNATPSASVDLSGTAYQSEGGSVLTSRNLKVYKNGSTLLASPTTDSSTGTWSATGLNISSGDIINVYIDGDNTYKGNTVFVSDGSNQTNINIYGGVLIMRHDTGSSITNANLSTGFVSGDTTDMMYTISGSDITGTSSAEIHVWTGDTYSPGGKIVTQNGAGNFHLDDNSNATLGTADNSISKDIIIDSGATLTISNDTSLGGNLTNNGTFTHSTGAFKLVNSSLTTTITSISDISFVTLKSTAAGKIIKFQKQTSGSPKFTITGSFNFQGVLGNPIMISSDTPGSQWNVYFSSTQNNMNYIRISDSGCASGSSSVSQNTTIYDGGNNGTCWNIVGRDASSGVSEDIIRGGGSLKTGGNKNVPTDGTILEGGGATQTGGNVSSPTTISP